MTGPTWWDEVAVGALLGTDRRPARPEFADLPPELAQPAGRLTGDPAAVLLDAAALAVAYRRAGAVPARVSAQPNQAPAESLPRATRRAGGQLAELLAGRDLDLLVYWCETAARAGILAPVEELPALLDLAARQPVLRAAIVPVLGARGRWLADQQPTWARMLTAAEADLADFAGAGGQSADRAARALLQAAGGGAGAAGPDPQIWQLGSPAPRSAWLRAVRRIDPTAAREALAASWAQETGPHRASFLPLLGENLGPADEGFLEAALDDRRHDVRAAAAELLARLPGSAFAGRMRTRALAFVRLERGLLRSRVVIELPDRLDGPAARDGITDGRAAGQRAARTRWWLEQVVAATPLTAWAGVFGSPEAALAARIEGDEGYGPALRAGWAHAAVRQQDRDWALAVLGAGGHQRAEELLAVLGPEDQEAVLRRRIRGLAAGEVGLLTTYLSAAPVPWPEPVVVDLLAWLRAHLTELAPVTARPLLNLMAYRVPVAAAPAVTAAVTRLDPTDPWRPALAGVARMITVRTRIHEELQ